MRLTFSIGCLIIALLLSACGDKSAPIATGDRVTGAPDVVNLAQGWTADTQERAWFASFGSRLIPYDWFLHLQRAGSEELLRDDTFLNRLGFLVQGTSQYNPDALPVGFTRTVDETDQAWVGLGCAACHTGQVEHGNHRIRIDGGSALLDFQGFEQAVLDALNATATDDARFALFAQRLSNSDQTNRDLRAQLIEHGQRLQRRGEMNRTEVPYGHGRLDAFGQIFNAAAVEFLGLPQNRHPPDAPVSFPFLWGAPHLDLVQWNGSAPNSGPGPLFQNITTALAVYGQADIAGRSGLAGYPSTVDFDKLGKIQDWMYQLTAPKWPESMLGELDDERIGQGSKLYAEHCQSCHQLADSTNPKRKLQAKLVPIGEIGTDPRMVGNFMGATVHTGSLEGHKLAVVAGPTLDAKARAIDLVVHVTTGVALRHPRDSARAGLQGYHRVFKAQIDQQPDYYKARPLHGAWATAPFLHNGSVPNLHELLLPPAQRSDVFYVGSRELDLNKVGFDTTAGPHRTRFDTSLPGNGNGGHSYGTQLTEEQRRNLIEYLKSI